MSDQIPGSTHTAIIKLHQVVKTYKNAAGEFNVLKGLDLHLHRGQFVAIVGKSGSGKSTLLNMMTGIDHPTAGSVVIDGVDLYQMSESERALWRGKNLGIVFQFFQLLPTLTLLENVMLPMDYVGMYDFDERPMRARRLLEMVGMGEFSDKLPGAVSQGQQQSAAIARALANDPPIIVADEPTGNLDSKSAENIIALFSNLVDQGKTIIMVTHDPSMTEKTSRTIVISDGELINETIATSLPLLTHKQLLEASRICEQQVFPPNTPIVQRKQHMEYFYMIQSGQVDIVLERKKKKTKFTLGRLSQGDFFGEIELLCGGKSIASVRTTADSPVELVALKAEAFKQMISNSPLTEEALGKIVQERLANHKIADCRKSDNADGKKKKKAK